MPKVLIPLSNTDSTTTRIITKSIIEQLLFQFNVTSTDEIIYIPRASKENAQSQQNKPNEPIRLETDELVKVEYEETFDQDNWDVTKYQLEYPSIFSEPKLGVTVTPSFFRSKLQVTVTFSSKSYDTALQWLMSFRRYLQTAAAASTINLEYTYTIPAEVLAYIVQVHTLSENVSGYGIDLKTFVTTNFAEHGLMIRSNSNDQHRLTMTMKNTGIACIFDDIPTKIEQQKEPPVTTLSFSCTINFDRVSGIILEYQHYIHNQKVDLSIVHQFGDRRFHGDPMKGHKMFSHSIIDSTDTASAPMHYDIDQIQITDGWVPKDIISGYKTFAIIPLSLNPNNLRELLNLNDLFSFGFTPLHVENIILVKEQVTKLWNNFLLLSVHSVTDVEANLSIRLDGLGNLSSVNEGDLRARHYLVISVLHNLNQMKWQPFMK